MTIHFVCRGNVFRSLMAEAYMRSLHLKDVEAFSTGTVGERDWRKNVGNYKGTLELLKRHGIAQYAKEVHGDQLTDQTIAEGDITIFMNDIAHAEGKEIVNLPYENVRIWGITDIGEPGRAPHSKAELDANEEDVYQEITYEVDKLVKELHLTSIRV